MRFKSILPLVVGFFLLATQPASGQEADGFWPSSVKIDPLKKEIFYGEELSITLTDFRDADGRRVQPQFLIAAQPEAGKIVNGEPSALLVGKEFPVGDGTVEIRYFPPPDPKIEEDRITISSVNTAAYWDEEADLPYLTKIGQVDVVIRRYDYARIIYHDYSLSWDDGGSKYLSDIDVSVGVAFKSIGGGRHAVERVAVLTSKGVESQHESGEKEYKSTLVSARIQTYTGLVVFHMNDKGEAEAVTLPVVNLALTWSGDSDNPPDDVTIAPVSEYDAEEATEAAAEVAMNIKPSHGQRKSATLPILARMLYHPDFRVIMRSGNEYLGGEGNFKEHDEHDVVEKTYRWEVCTKPQ